MPRARVATGMDLEYDTCGSPADPALLLIMGFTAQMTLWQDGFCKMLADQGLFVIRFDNRDCGLSTKLDGVAVELDKVIGAALSGQPVPPVPYTLSDMAADAVGLLDALGIEHAHIMGASMGGMIAQTVAIEHPARTASLTSIMSMPGEPEVGQPSPEAAAALLAPPPTERQAYIDASPSWMVWQSKKYRDEDLTRRQAAADYDRSFYPEGAPRQLAAIYASGARTEGLAALDVPALVIHGMDDTLITPSGGFRTAELIPGSVLLYVADMGHDMPEPLWPFLVDVIAAHVRRAEG
ncbi:MAG: alpha/beta fold hydrolase [Ilumatobacteraceae bacterium]